MNEQLTITASKILEDQLQSNASTITSFLEDSLNSNKSQIVENFMNSAIEAYSVSYATNSASIITWAVRGVKAVAEALTGYEDNADFDSFTDNLAYIGNDSNYEITYALISNSSIRDTFLGGIYGNSDVGMGERILTTIGGTIQGWFTDDNLASQEIYFLRTVVDYIKNFTPAVNTTYKDYVANLDSDVRDAYTVIYQLAFEYYENGSLSGSSEYSNLISGLGEYFKNTAWYTDVEDGGWSPTSVSVVSAILYTIFVFQSIGFLISYIKRLFMVVVLAVVAPVVIIYDFFMKSTVNANSSVFSSWLREFCTLVFVQAFQAFMLAIILAAIVACISSSYMTTVNDNAISGIGVLAIIALISLPRIELLLKNIFGLTSGVADTSLAAGQKTSFTGSMLAVGSAKRLMDNGGKLLRGAGNAVAGGLKYDAAKRNLDNYKNGLPSDDSLQNEGYKLGSGQGGTGGSGSGTGTSSGGGAVTQLAEAMKELNATLNSQSLNAQKTAQDDKLKSLQELADAAKKQRNEGAKEFVSGAAETIGAAHGAVAGAVIGAGTGKGVGDYALKGAGAGDVVGEKVVNSATQAARLTKDLSEGIEAEISSLEDKIKSLNKEVNNTSKTVGNSTNTTNTNNVRNVTKVTNITNEQSTKENKSTPSPRNINKDNG